MSGFAPGASITIGTHMWIHWLQIACDAEIAATQARERSLALGAAGEGFGDALTAELQASMVAISASASAIDALYGEIKPRIPVPDKLRATWKAKRTARHRQIFETLKLGLALGYRTNTWPSRFDALYDLRDPVTHHEIKHLPSVPHPNGLTNSGHENASYCLENASASVSLAYEVVYTALGVPESAHVREWAASMPRVRDTINAYRANLD